LLLTDRQNVLLYAAATMGGSISITEGVMRRRWHADGVAPSVDDRADLASLLNSRLLTRCAGPDSPLICYCGPTHWFRLTPLGFRAAWNVAA
jgi:hypothetical protein